MKEKYPVFILSLVVLMLTLTVLVSIVFSAAGKDDTLILTYAESNVLEGTTSGAMALAFKEKVEELSGGTIRIDIQAGGVLGSEEQVLDNMLGGGNIADISRISAFALSQYGCEKASLLGIPYTFVDEEHFWNFADSDLAEEFLQESHEKGLPVRGLCYGEEGFRNFFFKEKVEGIEDLKNKKIRVNSDPTMVSMVKDLGGSASTIAFGELYSALSAGVIDGAEQPTANYRSNAFHEVAPCLLLDGHTLGVMELVMADYRWQQLSEKQRDWIMQASEYAKTICKKKVAEIEAENLEKLKKDGVTIVEVDDRSIWAKACQNTINKNSEKLKKEYQQILDMQ